MLITCGINHKTAPIKVRELLAFGDQRAADMLRHLIQLPAVNEAVLLSTCNRTEIYAVANHTAPILNVLSQQSPNVELSAYHYQYHGIDTVRHLMRVASGLDSMLIGEPQILGQIKQAYQFAYDHGGVGQHLQHLFPNIFAVSKQVRANTEIGKNSISLAHIVVQLAQKIFNTLNQCRVLLLGAGEIIHLVATHLSDCGVKQIIIANRTLEKSQQLATLYNAKTIRFNDVPNYLPKVDIIVTATASQLPILGKGAIETALKNKKRHPLLITDLGLPRDVEAEVSQLTDVYLYNIDQLQTLIEQNLKSRVHAAAQAEKIIDIQANHYMRQLHVLNAREMIHNYRKRIEQLKDQEYQKALKRLQAGDHPQAVLQQFAHNFANKLMHQPTINLRQAAYDKKTDLLLAAKKILLEE